MPNAHTALINLANHLGYTSDLEEICRGTTIRCLESYLLGEEQRFIGRINLIIVEELLDQLIQLVLKKGKNERLSEDEARILDEFDEEALLEILAFYDSLFLYQTPHYYADLFGETFSEDDTVQISGIAASEAIREQGGLTSLSNLNCTFTKKTFKEYLQTVQTLISPESAEATRNFGLLLRSDDHAIGLFYQANKRTWTVMDINQWPPVEMSLAQIDDAFTIIRQGFLMGDEIACNINLLIASNKNEATDALSLKLAQHSEAYSLTHYLSQLRRPISVEQNEILETLLKIAVQTGNLDEVLALLDFDVNPNVVNDLGKTPLYTAAQDGYLDIVKALLNKGADPSIAQERDTTPLFIAAQLGHLEIVKVLLANHAAPNQARINGETPLYIAASRGHIEIVKHLLENGADTNLAQEDGQTPLLIAADRGHLDALQALLDKNADPNLAHNIGVTPLFVAAQNGNLEIVQALLGKGADPNQAMTTGVSPLYQAAWKGHLNVVQALLDKGALPDQAKNNGATPLYIAARKGHDEIVAAMMNRVCEQLQETSFGSEDTALIDYIQQKRDAFDLGKPIEKMRIFTALNTTLNALKTSKALTSILNIIAALRAQQSQDWFPVNVFQLNTEAKASEIERFMQSLNVDERLNLVASTENLNTLLEILAKHHLFGLGEVTIRDKGGNIDHEKAERSYKQFKSDVLDAGEEEDEPSSGPSTR